MTQKIISKITHCRLLCSYPIFKYMSLSNILNDVNIPRLVHLVSLKTKYVR